MLYKPHMASEVNLVKTGEALASDIPGFWGPGLGGSLAATIEEKWRMNARMTKVLHMSLMRLEYK